MNDTTPQWLNSPYLDQPHIASEMKINRHVFRKKRLGTVRGTRKPDHFTPDELIRLESIRLEIIAELSA